MATYARFDAQPWVLRFAEEPAEVNLVLGRMIREGGHVTGVGSGERRVHVGDWHRFTAVLVTSEEPPEGLTVVDADLSRLYG